MDLGIADKVFIVTGGSNGLGLATARVLLAEGARVLISSRTEGKIEDLRAELGARADDVAFLCGDNADAQLPERLKSAVLDRWGRLDGLLVSVGGPAPGHAMTTTDEAWREAFESVFLGTVRLVRDLAPVIADGGAIALVLAISAKDAAPNIPLSNGLRPGLAMLAKNFADELGPRGVRINTLLPNLFATDRVKRVLGDQQPPVDRVSLKRIGQPEELGRMAAVLLSPVASYVTGTAMSVDGGQLKML